VERDRLEDKLKLSGGKSAAISYVRVLRRYRRDWPGTITAL
jgi:hypothetical protein